VIKLKNDLNRLSFRLISIESDVKVIREKIEKIDVKLGNQNAKVGFLEKGFWILFGGFSSLLVGMLLKLL